ncbi:MAG: heat-shock protein [Rhodospirillales bacterium]|nr:heat-shock protein [Rhodospirillales bacterium]
MIACGLDFGTSNSAIGVLRDGVAALAPVEGDRTLIPSAVFFDYETKDSILFGAEAIDNYIAQVDGRLMRSLKSVLGSSLIDETTALAGRKVPFIEIIEIFARHLKTKAETFLGQPIDAVVHGRPVRFVDDDDAADAKAQDTLEGIARRVGFRDVTFVYEPIAAAYHYEETATREEIVLIADIGGGTSDFTVIRIGADRRSRPDRVDDILANAGAHIGGTDFDSLFSLNAVMPMLGLGTHLIQKNLPMPMSLYVALSTWATINFSYTPRNERQVVELLAGAREPRKVGRLLSVIQHRLGHRIAMAVEQGKVALSDSDGIDIGLAFIEGGLHTTAKRARFEGVIRDNTERLRRTASACIAAAGLNARDIQTIFFTGGSSLIPAVRAAIAGAAPDARVATGSNFLSVASGLTLEAARRFA